MQQPKTRFYAVVHADSLYAIVAQEHLNFDCPLIGSTPSCAGFVILHHHTRGFGNTQSFFLTFIEESIWDQIVQRKGNDNFGITFPITPR